MRYIGQVNRWVVFGELAIASEGFGVEGFGDAKLVVVLQKLGVGKQAVGRSAGFECFFKIAAGCGNALLAQAVINRRQLRFQ